MLPPLLLLSPAVMCPVQVVAGFAENQQYGLGTNSMTGEQKSLLIYGTLAVFFIMFLAGASGLQECWQCFRWSFGCGAQALCAVIAGCWDGWRDEGRDRSGGKRAGGCEGSHVCYTRLAFLQDLHHFGSHRLCCSRGNLSPILLLATLSHLLMLLSHRCCWLFVVDAGYALN